MTANLCYMLRWPVVISSGLAQCQLRVCFMRQYIPNVQRFKNPISNKWLELSHHHTTNCRAYATSNSMTTKPLTLAFSGRFSSVCLQHTSLAQSLNHSYSQRPFLKMRNSFAEQNCGLILQSIRRKKHTKPRVPPTRINNVYDIEGPITDAEIAKQFVYSLNSAERKHLYAELARFHGDDTSVPGVDPQLEPPTRQQLKQVLLHQMFPFIGFGFLDNFLMIVAGEYIDVTLGVTLGISTMAAAALGNLISDVAGLGSAHYVENWAAKIGVKNPHLSPTQVDMGSTKWASNMGKVIGVTIGCLLGMMPLLFFKDEKKKVDEDKTEAN